MNLGKRIYLILIVLTSAACTHYREPGPLSEEETRRIEKAVLGRAESWLESWNGEVDSERMMSNYHPEMKYVWRGVSPPGDYDGNRSFAENMSSQKTNYQLTMSNVDITVLDKNNAVVFFHFNDRNGSPYGSGAASLVITKKKGEWKVMYVHESKVEGEKE